MDLNEIGLKAREFSATLRAMDKQVKEWHVYKGVEDNVKNLLKSLSSVTELRSPSIRNRHWNELMRKWRQLNNQFLYHAAEFVTIIMF